MSRKAQSHSGAKSNTALAERFRRAFYRLAQRQKRIRWHRGGTPKEIAERIHKYGDAVASFIKDGYEGVSDSAVLQRKSTRILDIAEIMLEIAFGTGVSNTEIFREAGFAPRDFPRLIKTLKNTAKDLERLNNVSIGPAYWAEEESRKPENAMAARQIADSLPGMMYVGALLLSRMPHRDAPTRSHKSFGRNFLPAQFVVYLEKIGGDIRTAAALLRMMRDAVIDVSPGLQFEYRIRERQLSKTQDTVDPFSDRAIEKSVSRFFERNKGEREIMKEHVRVFFADPRYRTRGMTFLQALGQLPPRGH